MDDRETKLCEEIDFKRSELVLRAEALRRSTVESFDPREKLRSHPLAGVLASIGAGIILGLLPGWRRTEPGEGSRRAANPLIAVVAGLLPGLLPALIGPLLSLLGRFHVTQTPASPEEGSTQG